MGDGGSSLVVSVMMSVVMLMLALALLRCFKGRSFQNGIQIGCCSGLLVILALVRQQGLYPPVEAVSP
ncbi:MAG: hypothetical protein AAFO06_09665 [Cyanobacteria bacterium J06597_16]